MSHPPIPRHKTAIRRGDLSRPMKLARRDALIDRSVTVFDYGCGHGEDLDLLVAEGVTCGGWDPTFRPDGAREPADVVNLGYVINVIEDPEERAETIRAAWVLCRDILVVSAQVVVYGLGRSRIEFGDGVLTGRGTFQKFFEQDELKTYLESVTGVEAIPAGLGVFYLFRDEAKKQQHLANHYRRRILPRPRTADSRLEANRELLNELLEVCQNLGRPPEGFEFPRHADVVSTFGSIKRGFAFVRRITGEDEWEQAARARREDLLVFLALSRFQKRPALSGLPQTLQRDVKYFLGSYTAACSQADELLFRAGDAGAVDEACGASAIGKKLPDDLYIHADWVESLEPLLRVYEGCGRAYLGRVEGANIIKIHRRSGKLSYLSYPDFDTDPHPALTRCVKLSLRTRVLECFDYVGRENPPVLHRKETFLHADDPRHARFSALTAKEEAAGLLAEPGTIGTRDGWTRRLVERGFQLKGHRLLRIKTQAAPQE